MIAPAARRTAAVAVPTAFCVIGSLPIFFTAAEAVGLQHDLGFGRPQLGLAISLGFASSAVCVVPLGRMVARWAPTPDFASRPG